MELLQKKWSSTVTIYEVDLISDLAMFPFSRIDSLYRCNAVTLKRSNAAYTERTFWKPTFAPPPSRIVSPFPHPPK